MPSGKRALVRRLAMALITAQVAAFALIPVIESLTSHDRGHPSVQATHEDCTPAHQDAACLSCVLAAARARTPERVRLVLSEAESRVADVPGPAATRSRTPPPLPATRAPPHLAA